MIGALVLLGQPFENDRGIETAGVGENYFVDTHIKTLLIVHSFS
jgi:hypothetical protein